MSENEGISIEEIQKIIADYVETVRLELTSRIDTWREKQPEQATFEVVGGLLFRQITLATQLAQAPQIWNGHSAPLFLRAMCDNHISLAFILESPADRAEQFILYGLGQVKLHIEHRKARLPKGEERQLHQEIIENMTQWLNSQRFQHLLEVNVSTSWSGKNTREMAIEVGEENFYLMAYQPFSACSHNTWQHIINYNLQPCAHALHKPHRDPCEKEDGPDVEYLRLAAKYAHKSLFHFDKKVSLSLPIPESYRTILKVLMGSDEDKVTEP